MHTTATETPAHVATETPAHVARLIEALSLAVSDRRRVDELVTLFEYDGLVEAAGERYSGQGAVKRFFSSLLLENGFTSMDVLAEPFTLTDGPEMPVDAPPLTLALAPAWSVASVPALTVALVPASFL